MTDTEITPDRGDDERPDEEAVEEFGELIRYTGAGYAGGLALAGVLDALGLQTSAWGQWVVRTLAGEGESILEGIFSIKKWIGKSGMTLAQAYGWGKFFGLMVPWIVDGGSRMAGLDVYGVGGFFIPYFYAMSDQIGASAAGYLYFHRRAHSAREALGVYLRNPVMITGLGVVFAVPFGLLLARSVGFSPTTQVLTAFEVMAANLCWLPPLVGWLAERRRRYRADEVQS